MCTHHSAHVAPAPLLHGAPALAAQTAPLWLGPPLLLLFGAVPSAHRHAVPTLCVKTLFSILLPTSFTSFLCPSLHQIPLKICVCSWYVHPVPFSRQPLVRPCTLAPSTNAAFLVEAFPLGHPSLPSLAPSSAQCWSVLGQSSARWPCHPVQVPVFTCLLRLPSCFLHMF